ncbi:MAG: head decoration protein [Desulfobacterales bacterium]|nr:head decoration protein [Desulfobacterales bacterium]
MGKVLIEKLRLSDVLKGEMEAPTFFSREKVTIESLQELLPGSVVGKKLLETTENGSVNSAGDMTCTEVSMSELTIVGDYIATCIDASVSGSEVFDVQTPDGFIVGKATVGVPFVSKHINFTLNDGGADAAVNDTATITVTEGSGEVVEINFAAVDGSQKAVGFSYGEYDCTSGSVDGVIICRNAYCFYSNLQWPETVTEEQKTKALAELNALGILNNEEA